MSQGKPSSMSSRLRSGGRALLYAQPVNKAATFRPSGDPDHDPPEVPKDGGWIETVGRAFNLDTPEGRDYYDAWMASPNTDRIIRDNQYWEKLRFKQGKSLRAKKRELRREARRNETPQIRRP